MWYKRFCREFFDLRINMFTVELVNHISFKKFYEQFVLKQKNVKFQDLKGVLADIFGDLFSEFVLYQDACSQIVSQNCGLYRGINMRDGAGALFEDEACLLCSKRFDLDPSLHSQQIVFTVEVEY
mmetsp:Transcript_13234/g.9571  ORF Transcript_13234/g.9571 Transcript_13234/m.9571 type:complete len:125 (+) Transcript_13234:98-472(+)